MQALRSQSAQAAVELVAIVPLVLVCALAIGQLLVAGWALLSAGEAARAGARAAHVNGDVRATARHVVPGLLEPAVVRTNANEVTVRVRAPGVLPGLPRIPVSASAALDPGAGAP